MFRKLTSVVLKIIVSFVLTRPFGKNLTLVEPKMTKINALFMTKTAEKPFPLGPHILKCHTKDWALQSRYIRC